MPEVVGVICEYDPFHLGHAQQFALIREALPQARIVCVMSGCFTQRGMPALHAPAFRARAALRAGADVVLELPALFALREAEHFALGGVSILHGLGFVTHVSFGCENQELGLLQEAAALLESPTAAMKARLKAELALGKPFAAAQSAALEAELKAAKSMACPPSGAAPLAMNDLLCAPNNILGISYLRAFQRLGSRLIPLPVLRVGSYHAKDLAGAGFPSATAVRAALLRGDFQKAEEACAYPLSQETFCPPDALDAVLLSTLRRMSKGELSALPDCSEGLENRLFAACRAAAHRGELLQLLKSKRYTHARLSRLLTHGLLGVTQALQAQYPLPTHTRLLGFRQESEALLSAFRESSLPIIAKAAQGPMADPSYRLDQTAYDLWALGAKKPAGLMLRQPVQRV